MWFTCVPDSPGWVLAGFVPGTDFMPFLMSIWQPLSPSS